MSRQGLCWVLDALLPMQVSSGVAEEGGGAQVIHSEQTRCDPVNLPGQMDPKDRCESFGQGMLSFGHACITLDPQFVNDAAVDRGNSFAVFVQLRGDCRGVYVKKGATRFEVKELQGGVSSVPFDFRVVARRDRSLRPGECSRALNGVWMLAECLDARRGIRQRYHPTYDPGRLPVPDDAGGR